MSKAEKFIQDYTRNCSNLLYRDYIGGFDKIVYNSWLTPDQARRVAEIAREETINEVCEWLEVNLPIYISYYERGIGEGSGEFIDGLKKYFK